MTGTQVTNIQISKLATNLYSIRPQNDVLIVVRGRLCVATMGALSAVCVDPSGLSWPVWFYEFTTLLTV